MQDLSHRAGPGSVWLQGFQGTVATGFLEAGGVSAGWQLNCKSGKGTVGIGY